MFTAAVFPKAPNWKQFKCPSVLDDLIVSYS
jgi:hypothetical protein